MNMEQKINIAELLKDCPKGTKLYSPYCGECELVCVTDNNGISIKCEHFTHICFEDGAFLSNGECLLFPSKENRDWSKFQIPIKPKFKVGDKIIKKNGICDLVKITSVGDELYYSNTLNGVGILPIKEQDDWELVPNKFDINTLKPFDKVLVRVNDTEKWIGDFYMLHDDMEKDFPFICISGFLSQCIPYEGNEHLLGTTNDCDEFYKVWE